MKYTLESTDEGVPTIVSVKSSSGGNYRIRFNEKDGRLRIFCYCDAGINGMLCKHKTSLLEGNTELLESEKDMEIFRQIIASPGWAELQCVMSEFEKDLNVLDKEIEVVKKRQKALKKETFAKITFF